MRFPVLIPLAIMLAAVPWLPARGSDPLSVDHWLARCADAERVLADEAAVAALNRRMLDLERSVTDLAALPVTIVGADIAARITRRSRFADRPLVRADGSGVDAADRGRWHDSLGIGAVPAEVRPRFALVARRAPVRRFPTAERVYADPADTDIDQFQESAFFPGTPVAAVHAAVDPDWWFVIGPTYDGWVSAAALAFGTRDEVLAFAARSSRVVTGARVASVFTPNLPAASQVTLDMGAALPERRDWPAAAPVNGQSAAGGVVVELPLRAPDGSLRVAAALLPGAADTRSGPLPATRGNVLRQAFKFLGERYGWGHDFDGRDCSGLVNDVYRSLGILLPRNTADLAVCPALSTTPVGGDWPRERRIAALAALLPGDLVFTRGHVMIVIGQDASGGGPWVIHDTHDGRAAGSAANGVVVQRLLAGDGGAAADRVTALVRVLPQPATESP